MKHRLFFFLAALFALSTLSALALSTSPNEYVYYASDFASAETGFGTVSGFEGWLGTNARANGIIESGFEGSVRTAYLGYDTDPGELGAFLVRPFDSLYPESERAVYTVSLNFAMMASSNGEDDVFTINITNSTGDRLAGLVLEQADNSIYARSMASSSLANTGYKFNPGVPGEMIFELDLVADTWSVAIGGVEVVKDAVLTGAGNEGEVPGRLSLLWVMRDQANPGDNYLLFDHVRIAAHSGPYPFIADHPGSQSVTPGETATLSVEATGEAPLAYQWYAGQSGDESTPIAGATEASWTSPPVNGQASYWVRVTSDLGSVDSNAAVLTPLVNPPLGMETVLVGDAGNPANDSGYGAVDYEFHIGTYPVTNAEYAAFLNAVAAESDPHGLYNPQMGSEIHGGIARSGEPGQWTYTLRTADSGYNQGESMAEMPVVYVSFWSAARFVNWLTTGKTEEGVYALNGVTAPTPGSVSRNQDLFLSGGVAVASEDEWFKAGHYAGGEYENYWDFAGVGNTVTADTPPGAYNSANFSDAVGTLTPVGAYSPTGPYGTYDQSGNTFEWLETADNGEHRARGGSFRSPGAGWYYDFGTAPPDEIHHDNLGFRITSGEAVIRYVAFTLIRSGAGVGEVYIDDERVDSFPHTVIVPEGTTLILSSETELFSTFAGWYGDLDAQTSSTVVTLDDDTLAEARIVPHVGPPITSEPLFQSVVAGGTVDLEVEAVGDDLTYQWYRGEQGDFSRPLEGETMPQLTFGPLEESTPFWVRVTDANGEFNDSGTAWITVVDAVGFNHWTERDSGVTDALYDIVRGDGLFVAVGRGGTILTSENGTSWTARDSGTPNYLYGVAWNGSRYVAVGSNGVIVTSADGINWTVQSSGTTGTLYSVAWGSGRFVAAGLQGTLLTSGNGADWTERDSSVNASLRDVVWNGEEFLVVGFSGRELVTTSFSSYWRDYASILTSADGVTWSRRVGPIFNYDGAIWNGNDYSILRGGGMVLNLELNGDHELWSTSTEAALNAGLWTGERTLVVGANGTVMSSPDGRRWLQHDFPFSTTLNGVAREGGIYVAVGSSGEIFTSTMGADAPPRITHQPADQSVTQANSARLSVSVQEGSMEYQWFHGERGDTLNPVAGATTQHLEVNDLQESARYWVRVTDSATGLFTDSETARVWAYNQAGFDNWTRLNPSPTGNVLNDVVFANGRFVAVGHGGEIHVTEDSLNWTQALVPGNAGLFAVAWNGEVLVAVGSDGTLWTSPDGYGWSERFSETAHLLRDVIWTGEAFVAVGARGAHVSSTDGIHWERADLDSGINFNAIAYSGARFVAAGDSGNVLTSSDGVNWSPVGFDFSGQVYDVAWDGSQFVAIEYGRILTSPDGLSWTEEPHPSNGPFYSINSIPSGLLITGRGALLFSTDGRSWTESTLDTNSNLNGAASGDGKTWVVGRDGTVFYSEDVNTWEDRREGEFSSWRGLAGGTQGIVAVGNSGMVYLSDDGVAWRAPSTPPGTSQHLAAVCRGPDRYVAVGGSGTIITSTDGNHWSPVESGVTQSLSEVIWTGSEYIAVGGSGTLLTSGDATNWVARETGTTASLNGVAAHGGRRVVSGYRVILISDDAVNWAEVSTSANLGEITHSGTAFVGMATGFAPSRIYTSYDGENWTPIPYSSSPDALLWDLFWTGSHLVAVGSEGNIWTSTDGLSWDRRVIATGEGFIAAAHFGDEVFIAGSRGALFSTSPDAAPETPVLAAHPQSQSIVSGTPAEFSVASSGANLRYQWFYGMPGDVSRAVEGATTATLELAEPMEEETLWVRVSHGYGIGVNSEPASLSFRLSDAERLEQKLAEVGITGEAAGPSVDPFQDGVANVLKYAFNMDLSRPDVSRLRHGASDTSGLPAIGFVEDGETTGLVIEFLRRRNSDLTYIPKFSLDLENWSSATGNQTVELIDEEWERVTIRQPEPESGTIRMFGTVEVALPPAGE